MKRTILVLAVLLSTALAAQGATKLYVIVETSGNSWMLKGWTSGSYAGFTNDGDANAGLASFSILMGGVTTCIKRAPRGFNTEAEDVVGFKMGPNTAAVVDGNSEAFAGQDTLVPQFLISGVGVSAGTYPDNLSWAYPALLFDGTFDPAAQTPMVRYVDPTTRIAAGSPATVFLTPGGLPPSLSAVYVVPEPATAALLVLGGASLWRRRRYRQ